MVAAKRGRSNNLIEGLNIAIGIAVAVIITIAFALIISSAISTEKLQDRSMGIFSKAVWLLASAFGCSIGVSRENKKKLVKGVIVTAGYILVLLITSVVGYESSMESVFPAILFAMLGSLVVCGIKSRGKKVVKRKWK